MTGFWGAPIARPDDGERAVRAALAMWRVGEAFRKTPMGDHPPLGRTRVDGLEGEHGVNSISKTASRHPHDRPPSTT